MSEETRESLKKKLLELVPQDGKPVGNTALARDLGWDKEQYWDIRNDLLDEGVIERGKGKGGSVRWVVPTAEDGMSASTPLALAEESPADLVILYAKERELYEPMRDVIRGDWAKDRQDRPIAVEITGMQGARKTGGRWTRPDIVSVSVRTWVHVPGRHIEVVTFEVKLGATADVTAVYEALAHLRGGTHAYVLLHVPEESMAGCEETLDEIREAAKKHGVGVIVAGDPSDYTTWDEHVEAPRHEPDPAHLDDFIKTQLSAEASEEITKAVR